MDSASHGSWSQAGALDHPANQALFPDVSEDEVKIWIGPKMEQVGGTIFQVIDNVDLMFRIGQAFTQDGTHIPGAAGYQ